MDARPRSDRRIWTSGRTWRHREGTSPWSGPARRTPIQAEMPSGAPPTRHAAVARPHGRPTAVARDAAHLYRRFSLAIAGVATAFYAVFIARTAFRVDGRAYFSLFDDGMISMRYARNLAHGAGLVWNAGQHPVEGYTNLLWTVWMALLHLTGVSDARASLLVMASGAAILVVNLFLVRALVEELAPGQRGAALAAMAATALVYPLAYWTLRGMEVGLVALLGSAMALYAVRLDPAVDRPTLAKLAAVMAAAALTRDDVLLPCLAVLAFVGLRCRENRRAGPAVPGGAPIPAAGGHEAIPLPDYRSAPAPTLQPEPRRGGPGPAPPP